MVSRNVFEKYFEIQKSGAMNMLSPMVEWNTGISKEDHLEIIENYKELFNRYKKNMIIIDGEQYPIEAEYYSEEKCMMDGYQHYKNDIYYCTNPKSAAIITGYY